jgi:hypothetical protein
MYVARLDMEESSRTRRSRTALNLRSKKEGWKATQELRLAGSGWRGGKIAMLLVMAFEYSRPAWGMGSK